MNARELDRLFSLAYDELRRLAAAVRGNDARLTVSPTGLVNEAWIRLSKSGPAGVESTAHFKHIVAQAMRHVLADMARARLATKRGGAEIFVTFDDSLDRPIETADEVLRLEGGLAELAAADPGLAQIVACRFFGGMTVEETAESLGVAKTTVEENWRAAKAWLKQRLRRSG